MNSNFMTQLPQYQLKSLVKQITHEKGAVTKEQRLNACEQLQKVLLELHDSRNMNCDPRSMLFELDVLFCTRISYDVKKAVAACIGTIGYIMAYKFKDFLTWLMENVRRAGEKQEDVKALYLRSLSTTFDLDKRQRRLDDESISATMTEVRTIMETNDYASILLPLLDISSTIADVYPIIFKPSFEDIVDVIIGWYVDIEQPSEVFEQCESTIKSFRRFWLQNISVGKELLKHFLDDAEGYVEEVRESKKTDTAPEDALLKSAALLRALTTILVAMGSDLTAIQLMQFIDEAILPRLVRCVDGTINVTYLEAADVLAAVAECVGAAIEVSRSTSTVQSGFDLIVRILLEAQLSPSNLVAVIQFFTKMIEKLPAEAIASQMERMIGPSGCLRSLRLSSNKEITEAVALVYRTALTPKALPSLQIAYMCAVGEMKAALNTMASFANAPAVTLGVDKAPSFESFPSADLAEWIFVFLVSAATSLANVKNSLIAMMGLSPNLFELFVKRMPLSSPWFVSRYPAAHYALVYVLKLHCEKQEHFLANCEWLTDRSRLPMLRDGTTAHHSAAELDALAALLPLSQLAPDSRRLCLDWLISFIKAIPKSASDTFRKLAEFQRTLLSVLKSAVVDKGRLKARHIDCVKAMAGMADATFWNALARAIVECVKLEGDATYLIELASDISIDVLMRHDFDAARLPELPLDDRRQSALNGSSFTAFHFRLITDYLLHGTPPSLIADESSEFCWSESLSLTQRECLGKQPSPTIGDKWQWALAEVGQFCVENRLKTPFGKPLETFLQFENEIRGLAKAVVSDTKPPVKKSVERVNGEEGEEEREPPSREWMRVRALLLFMEVFDKLMYNAYEGAVFTIAPVSKPARSFFRTNRRTCQEWLGRIRLALMTVALRNQCLAMVVRLANQAMFDLERTARKLPIDMDIQQELMLSLTAEALIHLGCEQAILGLYAWVKRIFNQQLAWLKLCADMAVGRYEIATAGWNTLLTSTDNAVLDGKLNDDGTVAKARKAMTSQELRFISAQTMDCYFRLRDWSSAEAWVELVRKRESEADGQNGVTSKAIRDKQLAYLTALSSFDGSKLAGIEAMEWDRNDRRQLNECLLTVTARKSGDNGYKQSSRLLTEMLEDVQEDGRAALLTHWPARMDASLQCFERIIGVVEQRLRRRPVSDSLKFDSSVLLAVSDRPADRLTIANDLIYWNEPVGSVADLEFYLNASIVARKTSNVHLSTKYLLKHLNVPVTDTNDMAAAVPVVRASVMGSVVPSSHQLRTARHASKLLWKGVERREGFALLSDTVTSTLERAIGSVLPSAANETLLDSVTRRLSHIGLTSPPLNDPAVTFAKPVSPVGDAVREQLSRALLCLGSWLQADADLGNILLTNEDSLFIKLIEERLSAAESSLGALDTGSVVGSLLILSAHICPELIKAQQRLADWAYKAGKRAIEGSSRDESVLLTAEEASAVTASLPEDVSDLERDTVMSLVSSLKSDDGGIPSSRELIDRLSIACPRAVYKDALAGIWERANARLFLFYGCAAQAYFAFLRHNSESSIATVTATLRLLRLLVKHADSIGLAIHEEFASTNPKAWQGVIPQLFARLNHPSPSVRETLCQLLGRVAELAPHTVCFPAVVGGDSSAVSTRDTLLFQAADTGQEDDEEVTDINDDNKDRSLMEASCARLVDGLRQQNERLVDDVRVFVRELQRITLLREERWLTVLTHLQHEMNKRLRQIEEEKQKTMRIDHLSTSEKEQIISDKTEILTRMAFKILEDLFERTCATEADTPNEAQFSAQYTTVIEHALSVYRYDKRNPQQAWQPFNQLLGLLAQRSNKRAALSHEISQISPVLAAMSGSGVPLPGQETKAADQLVTIAKFSPSVVILSTKTRPKKIGLIGSDGKQYVFLFKGQEDLHLDERIMQFLRICNLMLNEKRRDTIEYSSRNYSVTPLGARSGLIQWVDGATPIFHIYRKWQMREALANATNPSEIQRPSEMYYGKLAPALELKGVKDLENRQKWPLPVLKTVMSELMAATPQDLLAKEMWVRSANADVWWQLAQRFARSCSVMSMIGYVIGLGDRHLDNVLVDLDTGEIVHIDYNICFDKGRHLRVPETVPFRMTANMQTALGPTGVDGVFRLSCEHVLRVLRAGKETLMTLLEAFVYDPLVDWAGTHELGTANMIGTGAVLAAYGAHRPDDGPRLATEFAQKMFTIRRKEICVPWMANRESLAAALQTTVETLTSVASLYDQLNKLNDEQHGLEEDAAVGMDDPIVFEGQLQEIEEKQKTHRKNIEGFHTMISMSTMQVRTALAAHHRMMLDIRSVLKSLAHMETLTGHKADGRFNRYVNVYKEQFSEPLSSCLRLIDEPNALTATTVLVALQGFSSVLASLEQIYDALLKLDYERQQNEEWPTLGDVAARQHGAVSPPPGFEVDKTTRVPLKEEQNVHAKAIWRRVRHKLEGRDPDSAKRTSTVEQTDYIIREATSLSNLALMYEGWTAWV